MKTTKHFDSRMVERSISWDQIYEALQNPYNVKKGSNVSGQTKEIIGKNYVSVVIDLVNKKYVTCYYKGV